MSTYRHYFVIAAAALSVAFVTACEGFDPSDLPSEPIAEFDYDENNVFIRDSFERTDVLIDEITQTLFGWRGFIWDFGTPVLGLNGNKVEAVIMSADQMGPAADGEKALYIYGREGSSVHNIYLITQQYDLSEFKTIIIQFKYLAFGLNDAKDVTDGVDEYLRVEACYDQLETCGVGDTLDPDGLQNLNWTIHFEHDRTLDSAGFNGRNHIVSDWRNGFVIIDLRNNESFNEEVVFRFSARMRDGFVKDDHTKDLKDGVAIDQVVGWGSKLTIEEIF